MGDRLTSDDDLDALRAWHCRLTCDRWLVDLDDAQRFLEDRHLLTLTPDGALPSLFGACQPVADSSARGFAAWPDDKWWWDNALGERPGCIKTKLHRGKVLFLDQPAAHAVDPLCREEEARALAGDYGPDAHRLTMFLDAAGPTLLDNVKSDTGLDAKELRAVRSRLEPRGAVVSREMTVDAASGGHRHVSELALWSHRHGPAAPAGGLDELLHLAVRAAVLSPRSDTKRWFAWTVKDPLIDALVEQRVLYEPKAGWLTAPQ